MNASRLKDPVDVPIMEDSDSLLQATVEDDEYVPNLCQN